MLRKKLFLLFTFLAVSLLHSQENAVPFHSSDVTTYFSDEMKDMMENFYQEINLFGFFSDGYINLITPPAEDDDRRTALDRSLVQTNLLAGVYLKVHTNFAIAVNLVSAIGTSNLAGAGFYFNGGIIWNNRFGHIGLFGGTFVNPFAGSSDTNGFRLALVPVIYTAEFPLLGYIVKKVEGALNMNGATVHSTNVKLFVLPIGSFSLGGFYRQEPFLNASTRIFGGFLETGNKNGKLLLELGWQELYDITDRTMNYAEKTLYGKIEQSFGDGDLFSGSFSALISAQYYPIPKLGFSLTLPDNTLLYAQLYWWPIKDFGVNGFEFTFGYRIKFGF